MDEFELIDKIINSQDLQRSDVSIGIGDDAAVIKLPKHQELVVTTDTFISGVHFLPKASPTDIAHKALAVNLSDLAAMGATPSWFTMVLSIPTLDKNWLKKYMQGLFHLANRYNVQLVGGDIARGSLAITIQALGHVPQGTALTRSGARAEDVIYVTGTLGDAGLALNYLKKKIKLDKKLTKGILDKFNQPEPRVAVGSLLREVANACIDISDGLLADLGHILEKSHVGAIINLDQIPLSPALQKISPNKAFNLALTSGDNYELCFTVSPWKVSELELILSQTDCLFTKIGTITAKTGLKLLNPNGKICHVESKGYKHF